MFSEANSLFPVKQGHIVHCQVHFTDANKSKVNKKRLIALKTDWFVIFWDTHCEVIVRAVHSNAVHADLNGVGWRAACWTFWEVQELNGLNGVERRPEEEQKKYPRRAFGETFSKTILQSVFVQFPFPCVTETTDTVFVSYGLCVCVTVHTGPASPAVGWRHPAQGCQFPVSSDSETWRLRKIPQPMRDTLLVHAICWKIMYI